MEKQELVIWFKDIGKEDIPIVGGKCANLGELIGKVGVPVPDGFATLLMHTEFFWRRQVQKRGLKRYFPILIPRTWKCCITFLKRSGNILKACRCRRRSKKMSEEV